LFNAIAGALNAREFGAEESADAANSPAPPGARVAPPRRRERLLVVEDHIVNQRVAARPLEKAGYACDVAANGLEALQALDRGPYDAVLMDCRMREVAGYEATRELRRREAARGAGSRLLVIAMTAHAMSGDREKCLRAGM